MKDNFDDKIKHAFDDLEDGISPDLIWSGINVKLNNNEDSKKKKRRLFIWWFFGMGLGIMTLASLYYINYSSPDIADSAIASDKIEKSVDYSSSQIDEQNVNEVDDAEPIQDKVNVASTDGEKNMTAANESQYVSAQEVDKTTINESIMPTEANNNNPISIFGEGVFSSIDKQINEVKNEPIWSNQNVFDNLSKIERVNVSSLGIKKFDLLTANILPPEITIKVSPHFYINKDLDDSKIFNTIELYSGISLGNKSVSSTNTDYASKRNQSEMLLEQLGFGLRMQILRSHGFAFFAGARYSRLTDRWLEDLEYVEELPLTYLESKVEYPDGLIEESFAMDTFEHNISRYIEQFNSEHTLSIPLEMRYGTQFNNWTFAIGVGVDINYLFASEHKVLGLNGLPVIVSKESQWLSPSLSLGLHTSYSLSPNWNITANVNYRQLSINNASVVPDLNSKYELYGMELGIARRLGW